MADTPVDASPVDALPEYSTGAYYELDPDRHSEDAAFKADRFLRAFRAGAVSRGWRIETYADVGCGSGAVVRAVASGLRSLGQPVHAACGYDVYPGVESIASEAGLRFVRADFVSSAARVDLVTLFDVVEHVPDPIGFLRQVGVRCDHVGLHIPLDNNFNLAARDRFASKLRDPGHLTFLDAPQALTLLCLAGLRVVYYAYTPGFLAPSGGLSWRARALRLPRHALFRVSPWLLSKTLGGCSLMVLAETATGRGSGYQGVS